MSDASIEMPPLRRQVDCCADPDLATQKECALCAKSTCRRCGGLVNGRTVCGACVGQIQQELDAEQADGSHVPGGVFGGVIGSLVGGAIWGAVAVATGLAIGYLAVLVGFLAGYGVFLGAGKRKGRPLQIAAVGCSILGLLLGKYFIVAYFIMKEHPDAGLSYFDSRLFHLFMSNLPEFFQLFDLLWIFLAFGAAVRATRPTMTRVRSPRSER